MECPLTSYRTGHGGHEHGRTRLPQEHNTLTTRGQTAPGVVDAALRFCETGDKMTKRKLVEGKSGRSHTQHIQQGAKGYATVAMSVNGRHNRLHRGFVGLPLHAEWSKLARP